MDITKFGHSCLLIEEYDAKILIDPGYWSELQNTVTGIDAILITHKHNDHCSIDSLKQLMARNPNAIIYTNNDVGQKLAEADMHFEMLEDGQEVIINGVPVKAFGKEHARIYNEPNSIAHNVGYLVSNRFFYGGDNVEYVPSVPVEILALPVAGPWLKISMAIDFAKSVKPKVAFPVHDGFIKENAASKHPESFLPESGIEFIIPELGEVMHF